MTDLLYQGHFYCTIVLRLFQYCDAAQSASTPSPTHNADMLGYHPQVILVGRRINAGMGKYRAEKTAKQIIAVWRL